MADFKLTSYLPILQAEALKKAIERKSSTVEEEVQAAIEKLYNALVPQAERDEIKERIAKEEAEREKDLEGFCIVKLHDKDEAFFFALDEGANAYTIASNYYYHVDAYVGRYDLSTLAHEFGEAEFLSQKTYDVLLGLTSKDDRLRAVMEFDLEKSVMRVYDAKEDRWKVYDFMDVCSAVGDAEREYSATDIEKARKFWEDLEDKEIVEQPTETLIINQ